jgi:hypothetical protein
MRCGVWLDHRRAIVVRLVGDEATSQTIPSDVGGRPRRAGGSAGATAKATARAPAGGRRAGPQQAVAEDRLDRKRTQALRRYYGRVAAAVSGAGSIFVMGPGEAPGEFVAELKRDPRLAGALSGVESTDKMTEPQIVARVREKFGREARRRRGRERAPS